MEIECAEPGHSPHYFGEHPERDHNKEIGIQSAKFFYKFRVFEFYGLQHRDAMLDSVDLHRRLKHPVTAARGLVGHGDHADNIVTVGNQRVKTLHRKFGST